MRIEVKLDMGGCDHLLKDLGRYAPQAVMRSLNRATDVARRDAAREVAKATGLTQRQVFVGLTRGRATTEYLKQSLTASGRRISLIAFKPRQVARGVSVNTESGRAVLPRAFIRENMPRGSKRLGVYQREGRTRLPLHKQFHDSIADVVITRGIFDRLRGVIESEFWKVFQQQWRYRTGQ